ncbi:MAG: hypothetical protein HS119_10815 [Flavobacteriales bacterium]|nr:hypothetical protein [Flavobacteriales bacterium]
MNERRRTTANKGLAIAGGQCLIEALCFYFTFVLADSFVLRNARHRQAPNRQVVKKLNFIFLDKKFAL